MRSFVAIAPKHAIIKNIALKPIINLREILMLDIFFLPNDKSNLGPSQDERVAYIIYITSQVVIADILLIFVLCDFCISGISNCNS